MNCFRRSNMSEKVEKRSEPKVSKGGIIQAAIKVDSSLQEILLSTRGTVWPRVERCGRYRSKVNSDYYGLKQAYHHLAHEQRDQSVQSIMLRWDHAGRPIDIARLVRECKSNSRSERSHYTNLERSLFRVALFVFS